MQTSFAEICFQLCDFPKIICTKKIDFEFSDENLLCSKYLWTLEWKKNFLYFFCLNIPKHFLLLLSFLFCCHFNCLQTHTMRNLYNKRLTVFITVRSTRLTWIYFKGSLYCSGHVKSIKALPQFSKIIRLF